MNLTKIIKREILITSLTVIGIAIAFFGLTYAIYFTIDEKDIGTVSFGQLSFDMCMDESCSTGGTTYGTTLTGDVYPMNTTEGTSQTPYLFKVTNNATDVMYTKVYAAKEGASIDYTNVKLAAKVQGTSTYSYADLTQDASVLIDLQVPAGQTKIIEVYMWLDEEASNEVIGKTVTVFINAMGYYKPDDPNNLHTGDKFVANANTAILQGQTFDYTGNYQEFEAPVSGYYFIEAWGAQDGSNASSKGDYSSGYIYLSKGEKIYIYVGGTDGYNANSGGGLTDIRYFGNTTPTSSDLESTSQLGLNSRIMVSGGFISGSAGSNAITSSSNTTLTNNTLHYSDKYFLAGSIKSGIKEGNGQAKITYVGILQRTNNKLDGVRYIKDCINGNSVDSNNHWVEVQAIKDGTNIALSKTVSGDTTSQLVVDGIITSSSNASGGSGNKCVIVDLGNTYDLDEIAVWHPYDDGRVYNDNITYVSSDNSTWTEAINQVIPSELVDGKRVNAYIESKLIIKAGTDSTKGLPVVRIGSEEFYDITNAINYTNLINTNGNIYNYAADKTILLAKYNLYVGQTCTSSSSCTPISASASGYGLQSVDAKGYVDSSTPRVGVVPFSGSSTSNGYWYDTSTSTIKTQYGTNWTNNNIYDTTYNTAPNYSVVFLNNAGNANYSIAYYVEEYVNRLGMEASGRLLTYTEANAMTQTQRTNGARYWLGSASGSSGVRSVVDDGNYSSIDFGDASRRGVRPVIVVSTSDIGA